MKLHAFMTNRKRAGAEFSGPTWADLAHGCKADRWRCTPAQPQGSGSRAQAYRAHGPAFHGTA